MKRKMGLIGIFYILGLFFASFFANYNFLIILLIAAFILAFMLLIKMLTWKAALTAAFSLFIGLFIYSEYTENYYDPVISLESISISFYGKVTDVNQYSNDFSSYVLKGAFENGTEASVLCFTDKLDCKYGDKVTVTGTFSVPEKTYLYDSTEYYKGMSVFLQADSDCIYESFHSGDYSIVRKVQNYREAVQRKIYALSGRNGGSITSAMIFGQRQGLDERLESSFYHAGIGPMLALSGFHLILFSGICSVFGNRTRLQRIMQLFMTVFMTGLFAILSMWPVSVLRAGIMLLITRSACLFYRRSDPLSSLFISVVILTCTNPYLIHNVSFLLSVAGTFGINNFAPWITEKINFKGFIGSILKTFVYAALITVCTMPICMLYFPKMSLLAPISNVFFAPMCVIIMFLGIVIFFLGGESFISVFCGEGIKVVSELLADGLLWLQDNISLYFPSGNENISKMTFILVFMTLAVFYLTKRRTMVTVSIILSAALLFTGQFILTKHFERDLRIFVLGRNKGQVIAVTYNGRIDVIDYSYNNKNADYLRNFLDEYGINSIDCLYLIDNAGAAAASYDKKLSGVEVRSVLSSSDICFGHDGKICGQQPVISDFFNITAKSYEISADYDKCTVSAYGKTFYVSKQEDILFETGFCDEYDYFVTGGTNSAAVFECFRNGSVRELCVGRNIEILIDDSGAVHTRRLY